MGLDLNLKKSFPGFDIDVELSLGGEMVVLFGPSGAGKTLILKMISGIIRPDKGKVEVDGQTLFSFENNIDVPVRDRKIGYLFQDYALFPHMTVSQNIAYGINGGGTEAAKKVKGFIDVMRLTGLDTRYPHELSGGQKQRCALARTLAASPRILLLDEPFSALDYQVREKLRADLLNIHKIFPITTILVTHDLEEAFMLGKRIAVVNNGKIEQIGTREEVFYRPRTRNVARFIGVRNIFTGVVKAVEGREVIMDNDDIGLIKAYIPQGVRIGKGREVTFCIRPEEIIVIRPDKALDHKVQDNIVEGEILSTIGRGSTHILYLKAGEGEGLLKVELPNFVLRKLGLAMGKRIRVSLKKEDIWVIP